MESNNSLVADMRMLNELSKLKPEARKELIETLERQEKLEEEALQKNPNLHVETKLAHVLGELKDLRADVQFIKNTFNKCPVIKWWPIIIWLFIAAILVSIPSGKARPCPITV